MYRDLRFDGLRTRLAGVLVIVLLPVAALILNSGLDAWRQAEERARLDLERAARLVEVHQEQVASGARRLLASLASLPEIYAGEPEEVSATLARMLDRNPEFANLGVALPDGGISCSAVPHAWPVNAADQPWFQEALRTGGFAIGEYQVGRITRIPVLVFAHVASNEPGGLDAVVFAALRLEGLQRVLAEARPHPRSHLTVADRHGVVLASTDSAIVVGEPLRDADALEAVPGDIRTAGDSSPQLFVRHTICVDKNDFAEIFASIPADLAFAPARRTLLRQLAWLALTGIVGVLVAFVGLEALVVRPVKALVRAADRIASGDLAARAGVAEGPGEVAHLGRAFDHMASTLQRQDRDTERIHAALRSSEARFRRVVDSGMVGILFWNSEGGIYEANDALLHMVGYTRQDLAAGRVRWDAMTPTEYAPLDARGLEQIRRDGICDPFEKEFVRKDGSRVPILIGGASTDEAGTQGVAFVVDISQRKRAEEDLLHSQQLLRALSARLQNVREEERKHLSREIHDELGQGLTALKLDLMWLERRLPQDPALRAKLEGVMRSLDGLVESVRAIATELRPGVLDELGLAAAIEWQAREFETRTGIACTGATRLPEVDLDDAKRTALFRIFQETLTNVARHAGASRVEVALELEPEAVVLHVADNGRGLPEGIEDEPTSIGLAGMRERAHRVGGELSIESPPAGGTVIRVRVPAVGSAKNGGLPSESARPESRRDVAANASKAQHVPEEGGRG